MIEQEGYKVNLDYQRGVLTALWKAIVEASSAVDAETGEGEALIVSTEVLKALAMMIAYVIEMSPAIKDVDQAAKMVEDIANEVIEVFAVLRERGLGIRSLCPEFAVLGERQ